MHEDNTHASSDDTKQVAKNSAIGTLVVLGILAVVAAVVIPIVMHVKANADADQRHRERVSEITEDLIDQM